MPPRPPGPGWKTPSMDFGTPWNHSRQPSQARVKKPGFLGAVTPQLYASSAPGAPGAAVANGDAGGGGGVGGSSPAWARTTTGRGVPRPIPRAGAGAGAAGLLGASFVCTRAGSLSGIGRPSVINGARAGVLTADGVTADGLTVDVLVGWLPVGRHTPSCAAADPAHNPRATAILTFTTLCILSSVSGTSPFPAPRDGKSS